MSDIDRTIDESINGDKGSAEQRDSVRSAKDKYGMGNQLVRAMQTSTMTAGAMEQANDRSNEKVADQAAKEKAAAGPKSYRITEEPQMGG